MARVGLQRHKGWDLNGSFGAEGNTGTKISKRLVENVAKL
jgi:hypothetical protein